MKLSCLSLVVGATAVITVLSNVVNARLAPKTPQAKASVRELKEKRQLKKDFMEAMAAGELTPVKPRILTKAERYQRLAEKIVEGSKNVDQRKLYNYQSYNGNYQNYNGNGNDQQAAAGDDVQMDYVNYDASELGFEMSSFALKYAGCAAIKTYDENFDEAMNVETYVVFRLCPADKCNKYSITGCSSDYGEYLVEMKTYLSAITEYYDEKYEDYCRYCEGCDPDIVEQATTERDNCYAALQAEDWQTYYTANNGDMSGYRTYTSYANANSANSNGNSYAQASNYNSNSGSYTTYNANANQNYNNYYGNRKLANYNSNGYYNNNYNNYNNANYNNNNANSNAANQNGFGFYDEDGVWVAVSSDSRGYWGSDGMFYFQAAEGEEVEGQEYEIEDEDGDGYGDDECARQYAQDTMCDADTCGEYVTYCYEYDAQTQQEQQQAQEQAQAQGYAYATTAPATSTGFDISLYLECTEYTNAYGQMYWIAPHCGSNHYTISLGVFSDNECSTYIGRDVSLSTVLGYEVDSSEFNYFPKECISCDGADDNYYGYQYQYGQQEGAQGQNQNQAAQGQYYGEYASQPDYSQQSTVVAMCMALFQVSAKCNKNMYGYGDNGEEQNDDESCAFIGNVVYGTYDENGEVILDNTFDYSDWKNAAQYRKLKLDASQIAGLAISLLLVIGLLAVVLIMQRSIARKEAPWRPKRNNSMSGGMSVSRQNSGIVLGRSRSGPGAAPLI